MQKATLTQTADTVSSKKKADS